MKTEVLRDFGDDLLSYLGETDAKLQRQYEELQSKSTKFDNKTWNEILQKEENVTYQKLSNWLSDQIYDKSGSWNGEYFKEGSNAKKAYPNVEKTVNSMIDREEKIKKENGITGTDKRQYDRLKKLLKNDDVWKELSGAYDTYSGDLVGAMLKDLGFRDTPANRRLLYAYAYVD